MCFVYVQYSEWKFERQPRVVDSTPNTYGTHFEALVIAQLLIQLLHLLVANQASYGPIQSSVQSKFSYSIIAVCNELYKCC